MARLKVCTIIGTRPELIRLSVLIQLFDKYFDHRLVHTGQNYDYELSSVFFHDMEIRQPDVFFSIDNSSFGRAIGDLITKTEDYFSSNRPDALVVLGDTNSSLSSYVAKRMHIPIYHMEAGNRSFDANVPEEINRKMIDHIADFNLVYTENSRRHLLAEGLSHRRVYLTGSPMYEVLNRYMPKIQASDILSKLELEPHKYFLISVHREENVDYPENLRRIGNVLNTLAEQYQHPVIVSTHPRTRKRIVMLEDFEFNPLIQFLKPFGFIDYNYLQMNAICVVSDSGTISEESSILKFPAITIRNSMERPEAIDAGTIILSGFNPDVVMDAIKIAVDEGAQYSKICPEYQVENTAMRVLKLVMGTAKLYKQWSGLY